MQWYYFLQLTRSLDMQFFLYCVCVCVWERRFFFSSLAAAGAPVATTIVTIQTTSTCFSSSLCSLSHTHCVFIFLLRCFFFIFTSCSDSFVSARVSEWESGECVCSMYAVLLYEQVGFIYELGCVSLCIRNWSSVCVFSVCMSAAAAAAFLPYTHMQCMHFAFECGMRVHTEKKNDSPIGGMVSDGAAEKKWQEITKEKWKKECARRDPNGANDTSREIERERKRKKLESKTRERKKQPIIVIINTYGFCQPYSFSRIFFSQQQFAAMMCVCTLFFAAFSHFTTASSFSLESVYICAPHVSEWIVFSFFFAIAFGILQFTTQCFFCSVLPCVCFLYMLSAESIPHTYTRSPPHFFCSRSLTLRSTNVIYRMYVVFATRFLSFFSRSPSWTHIFTLHLHEMKIEKIQRIFPHSFLSYVSPLLLCVHVVCAALNTIFPTHTPHTYCTAA